MELEYPPFTLLCRGGREGFVLSESLVSVGYEMKDELIGGGFRIGFRPDNGISNNPSLFLKFKDYSVRYSQKFKIMTNSI